MTTLVQVDEQGDHLESVYGSLHLLYQLSYARLRSTVELWGLFNSKPPTKPTPHCTSCVTGCPRLVSIELRWNEKKATTHNNNNNNNRNKHTTRWFGIAKAKSLLFCQCDGGVGDRAVLLSFWRAENVSVLRHQHVIAPCVFHEFTTVYYLLHDKVANMFLHVHKVGKNINVCI